MNGNSAYSNGNSFDQRSDPRRLVLWFRLGLPVPELLVSGI